MDHCEQKKRKSNPRDRANFLSLITFFYAGSTFKKALKKDLAEDNLYEAIKSCKSTRCGDKLEYKYELAKTIISAPSAFWLICRRFGRQYLILGLLDLAWQILKATVETVAVSNLIGYFSPHSKLTKNDAYYNAALVLGLNAFRMVYMHNYILILQKFALKVRTAFSTLIYRKALKLSPTAMSDISLGNIVTLITKDVTSFEANVWTINDMWVGALRTVYVSYLIYAKMGPVSFIGIGMLFIVVPLQVYLAKVVVKMRLSVGQKTDERLQIMQEVLSAIKIIKMYTWERFFDNKVTEARRIELSKMLKGFYIRIVVILIGILSSRVAFYVLIMIYIWLGYTTNAEFVFYILGCFKNLKTVLAFDIPYGLARGAEMYASLIRINAVLNAEELEPNRQYEDTVKPLIELNNVTVDIKDKRILKKVNLLVNKGLTIVTGAVGSGKSSLLKVILKDYPHKDGIVIIKGSISYASQDPWLFPSSIKQNILFGAKYEDARYQEVVRVCALRYDFDLLEHGDETIVSDKGMNLSKGQQARVNLARAIYKKSNIYLLDDSLTALDSSVQDYIFNECIKKFLKNKICILVTQCNNHLDKGDNLLVLDEGSIISSGKPTEVNIGKILELNEHSKEEVVIKSEEGNCDEYKEDSKLLKKIDVYQETKREGSVDLSIYVKYFRYGGGFFLLFGIIILYTIAQFTESTSSKLLTDWVDLNQKTMDLSNDTNSTTYRESLEETNFTINLYSGAIVLSIVLDLIKFYSLLNFSRIASLNIHKAMTASVINAVMSFFDNHFIGNILNRFSQDLNNIDEHLSFILAEVMRVFFDVTGVILVISYVNWTFLTPAIIFLIVAIVLRQLYMPTGRSLKRLEAITRSPLVGHLNSSLEGLTTIRAYKAEDILKEEFDRHQDLYTSAHFMLLCTSRAFGFIVDCCCTFLIAFIVSRFLFFDTESSAGDVGLVLTQLFILSDNVQWGIRQWADLENQMTSVERLLEYTEIKQESKAGQVIPDWPKTGAVTFEKVSLTYSNNEQVLKNINFEVEAHQKVGIVGRTGAGKSSIISALFRLYDIDGRVLIDDVNTKTLSLDFLRQSIAIIPQDPVLFSGTMRSNIDPIGTFSDDEIWDALQKVKIKDMVTSLDFEINEKGSNFSSGQRQLICLARAIIRKNTIVVLDEATANMDPKTDALLHDTIQENFSNCTVFIIAHRLHSIIDSDKILVMDKGEVVEFDSPKTLLENKNGHFYRMFQQSNK